MHLTSWGIGWHELKQRRGGNAIGSVTTYAIAATSSKARRTPDSNFS